MIAPQRGGAEYEVPTGKTSFRAAARASTACDDENPEDEDDQKRRRKGDGDGDFQTLLRRRKFQRRAVNTYDSLKTIVGRTWDIAAAGCDEAAACLADTLDSMNPYCEPDACVIEIDGVDDGYKPPQDYYPLQL